MSWLVKRFKKPMGVNPSIDTPKARIANRSQPLAMQKSVQTCERWFLSASICGRVGVNAEQVEVPLI